MKRYLTIFLICLLAGQCALAAENKTIASNDSINAGQEWAAVSVWDTPPAHTTVMMTGGTVEIMSLWNASMLNMSGGLLGLININQNATLTLSGTGVIDTASVFNSGILNMNGGSIMHLNANQQATVNLSGGVITNMLVARDTSLVYVLGTNLFKTYSGGPFGYGRITGLWEDNSEFTIWLGSSETYSHINLVTIPEPVTLLLFTAAAPFVRRFRNRI